LRLYGRIEKRAGNKWKFARHASQTGKADARCIFIRKKCFARAARRGGDFNTLTLYIAKVSIFVPGERRGAIFLEKIFSQKLLSVCF